MNRSNRSLSMLAGLAAAACSPASAPVEASSEARLGPIPTHNDCGDPGWQQTLRCQALAVDGLADAPMPNLFDAPATEREVKAFTRVFLPADDRIRCFDGTYPAIYVDLANPPSDDWMFSMAGGGSCRMQEGAVPGVSDDANECTAKYENEAGEMGTSRLKPMKDLEGIHSPDATINPVFAGYNRVRIQKCSFDRFNGRATYEDVVGDYEGVTVEFDAYQQGFRIIRDTMDFLLSGITYDTWSWDAARGKVVAESESLPALLDAEKVLIVAHSGGAHGLMNNLDYIASGLDSRGVNADVRGLLDANYRASLENEAAFATDAYGVPLAGGLYSGHTEGVSLATATGVAVPFAYDAQAYFTDENERHVYAHEIWNTKLDQSCLASHASTGDDWRCQDRYHVLHNHISTPMFIRQDMSDPGSSHNSDDEGFSVEWGDWHESGDPSVCGWFGDFPCPPRMSIDEYEDRLREQSDTFFNQYVSPWEPAAVDGSIDYLEPPTLYIWMPDCAKHAGAFKNGPFFNTSLLLPGPSLESMHEFLEAFMAGPASGDKQIRQDGRSGAASVCP